MVSNLRARHKLIGIFEAQIREDVAGAFFELNWSEWTQAAATAGTRDLKAQDRDRGWPASAANASDFVQIPYRKCPGGKGSGPRGRSAPAHLSIEY